MRRQRGVCAFLIAPTCCSEDWQPRFYVFFCSFSYFFYNFFLLRQSTSLSNRLRRGKLKLTFEQLQLRRVNFKWLTIFGQAGVYFFIFAHFMNYQYGAAAPQMTQNVNCYWSARPLAAFGLFRRLFATQEIVSTAAAPYRV